MQQATKFFGFIICFIIISLTNGGWVFIPVAPYLPETDNDLLWGRGRINNSYWTSLVEGRTTREEALLLLGEPDAVLNDETLLVYTWGRESAIVFVPIFSHHYLFLEFDPEGYLLQIRKVHKGQFGAMADIDSVKAVFHEYVGEMGPSKLQSSKISSRSFTIVGHEMVAVAGGCFQMGDTFGDGHPHEQPVHEVCLDDFNIGKYEVTQGQWQEVMGTNPSALKKGDDYPVGQVSWNEVQDYIGRLNSKTGKNFRLPTEAEWEYACRSGGKNEKYCGGNDIKSLAWHRLNAHTSAHPVGTKLPNGLGIFDMSGNVFEWVQDRYLYVKERGMFREKNAEQNYYKDSPRDNPQGPLSGSSRVFRGGSWNDMPHRGRSAYRRRSTYLNKGSPGRSGKLIGFRLVLPSQ